MAVFLVHVSNLMQAHLEKLSGSDCLETMEQ